MLVVSTSAGCLLPIDERGMKGDAGGGFFLSGTLTVAGGLDPAGIGVTFDGMSVVTDAAGRYTLGPLPALAAASLAFDGHVTLPADAGFPPGETLEFGATIPALLVGADGGAIIEDADGSYPNAPIELPAGRQVVSSRSVDQLVAAPDGRLAFLTAHDPAALVGTLAAVAPGEAAPVPLVEGVLSSVGVELSPDGTRLAFTVKEADGGSALETVGASGGTPAWIASGGPATAGSVFDFGFSPDGRLLAFTNLWQRLDVAPAAGGAPPAVLGQRVAQWSFSPDSRHVAFLSGALEEPAEGTLQLASAGGPGAPGVWEATGIARNVLFDGFQFSPDGSQLVFIQDPRGVGAGPLEVVPTSGGAASTIIGLPVSAFQLSPDGRTLAFLTDWSEDGSAALHLAAFPDGKPLEGSIVVSALFGVTFSPDGSRLGFFAPPAPAASLGTLSTVAAAGGTPVTVAAGVFPRYAFSPDGSRVALLAGFDGTAGTLELIPTTGGDAIQIATHVLPGNFRFSPDGALLAYLADWNDPSGGALGVARVAGGAPVVLNREVDSFLFAGGALAARRAGTPEPFGFLDGVWTSALP